MAEQVRSGLLADGPRAVKESEILAAVAEIKEEKKKARGRKVAEAKETRKYTGKAAFDAWAQEYLMTHGATIEELFGAAMKKFGGGKEKAYTYWGYASDFFDGAFNMGALGGKLAEAGLKAAQADGVLNLRGMGAEEMAAYQAWQDGFKAGVASCRKRRRKSAPGLPPDAPDAAQ